MDDGQDKETLIRALLEKVRPYIQSHGGDVRLIAVREGTAVLTIEGTCVGCPLAELTYNKVIRKMLIEDVPGITAVTIE